MSKRKLIKRMPQSNKSGRSKADKRADSKLNALAPGRRVSKTGRKYTETRANRSDAKNKKI